MGYEARIEKTNRAVLAGLQTADVSDFEHQSSMDELERLVKTLGFITSRSSCSKAEGWRVEKNGLSLQGWPESCCPHH
jgi:hypothetical protein